jgi:HD-GYP domain-containing protein (c-di-GMP phosphodiesterase class II)
MLVALAASELAVYAVYETMRAWRGQRPSLAARQGLLAWLALGSSGVLMALGYGGVDGHGVYGLFGVALFATPLVAAVYSFERLHAITRISRQTIDALAAAPELGGLATIGHPQRVAATACDIGHVLGMSPGQLDALDTAARLHHLGMVTLAPDAIATSSFEIVAESTGDMLRDIDALEPARAIIEGETGLPSSVLRVANKYDHITEGNDRRGVMALAALRSGADDVYDVLVVEALARVVARRVDLQIA